MRKLLFFIICILFLDSCSVPSYYFDNKTQNFGVDFKTGKWLLNEIDAPNSVEDNLKETVSSDFKSILNDRLTYIQDAKGLLLPKKILLNPDKKMLSDLKNGTNFDYIINIKAKNIKNDFDMISITNHKYLNNETNSNEVILEIYDLNLLEIIYSQKVIGSSSIPDNSSSDVHFAKSSNSLILGAYKKLMKDLNKKSIK